MTTARTRSMIQITTLKSTKIQHTNAWTMGNRESPRSTGTCRDQSTGRFRRPKVCRLPSIRTWSWRSLNETEFWSSLETQGVAKLPRCRSTFWRLLCSRNKTSKLSAHSHADSPLSILRNEWRKSSTKDVARLWAIMLGCKLAKLEVSPKFCSWPQESFCKGL